MNKYREKSCRDCKDLPVCRFAHSIVEVTNTFSGGVFAPEIRSELLNTLAQNCKWYFLLEAKGKIK